GGPWERLVSSVRDWLPTELSAFSKETGLRSAHVHVQKERRGTRRRPRLRRLPRARGGRRAEHHGSRVHGPSLRGIRGGRGAGRGRGRNLPAFASPTWRWTTTPTRSGGDRPPSSSDRPNTSCCGSC